MGRSTIKDKNACKSCDIWDWCAEKQPPCPVYRVYEKLAHYEDLEEAGKLIEVIRCKDCDNYDTYGCSEGAGWCEAFEIGRFDNGYCDNAKLKELEGDKE